MKRKTQGKHKLRKKQKAAVTCLKNDLKTAIIFDGRNIYNPLEVSQAGLEYISMNTLQV